MDVLHHAGAQAITLERDMFDIDLADFDMQLKDTPRDKTILLPLINVVSCWSYLF